MQENCYTDSHSIPAHKLRPVVRQGFKLTTMQLDADVANSTRASLELLNFFHDVGAANLCSNILDGLMSLFANCVNSVTFSLRYCVAPDEFLTTYVNVDTGTENILALTMVANIPVL